MNTILFMGYNIMEISLFFTKKKNQISEVNTKLKNISR